MTGRKLTFLQVEQLGCEGKVEEAQGVMKLCEQLKNEREMLQMVRRLLPLLMHAVVFSEDEMVGIECMHLKSLKLIWPHVLIYISCIFQSP